MSSKIPSSIGRYDVLGSIGRGGMGSLYLALDPLLDRQIAIKLLRDDDDELRERFSREARAAARLRHPNIVTIFDVGEHEGQPFIAMEYIQGQTLAEIVRGNVAMPLVRKLELMEALCDGLGFAHKGGIVHRDIKPANLMLDADGSLKILDFGIARASESAGMTQAGMLIGTLNYMSPEQVSGQPVDLRSDLFAVGAVFYELVSYRQAFPGGLMAGILNKIISGQPDPLPSIVPEVDPEIVRIIDRALEKDPGRRYQDLGAMRQDILLARTRLEAVSPTRVLGTSEPADQSSETRFTPPPVRRMADLEGLARRRTEQIQSHMAEAERVLAGGDPDAAIASAEQALLLDAHHPLAHGLIDRARAMMEARQIDAALDEAAGRIASGDFEAAGRFLDEASAVDPRAPRIAEVRRSLDDALQRQEEARQREALEQRAQQSVAEAEQHFAAGRRDEAVALLAAFRPSHPLVAKTLERLRSEADRLSRQAADIARHVTEASALLSAGKLQAALEEVRAAYRIEGDHDAARELEARIEDAVRAEAERQQAEAQQREADARLAREREVAATAAIKEAKRAAGPEAALAVLRPALERDPDNIDLLRAIGANEAELTRAQARAAEEARQQAEQAERERVAKEAAERERAEREKAERERAAKEAAERERVAKEAAERERAEREKAERERAAKEAAERERAAKEAAEREKAAAAAAAAAAAKAAEVGTDDRTILLRRDEAVKPAAAPPAAKAPEPAAPKAEPKPKPKERPTTPAAAAKSPAAPPPQELPLHREVPIQATPRADTGSASPFSGNAVKFGGAAAALVLAVIGYFVFGGSSDSVPPPAEPIEAAEVTPGLETGGDEVTPVDPAAVPPVENTSAPEAASATPSSTPAQTPPAQTAQTRPTQAPPTAPATSALDGQLERLFDDAQRRRQGGDTRAALDVIETALGLRANDSRFLGLAETLRRDAEGRMNTARSSAQSTGASAVGRDAFADAEKLAASARQLASAGRNVDATRNFIAAGDRFTTAANEGRRIDEQARERAAAAAAAAAATATPAAPTRAAEETAIRAVVERFRQAYNRLDADAVIREWPSGPAAGLRRAFDSFERQAVTYSNVTVTIAPSGTTATVSATTAVTSKPKTGSEQSTTSPMTLSLAKQGAAWVITGRK